MGQHGDNSFEASLRPVHPMGLILSLLVGQEASQLGGPGLHRSGSGHCTVCSSKGGSRLPLSTQLWHTLDMFCPKSNKAFLPSPSFLPRSLFLPIIFCVYLYSTSLYVFMNLKKDKQMSLPYPHQTTTAIITEPHI